MFGVSDYGAFVVAVIVFLAIPGPGNLALITSTSKGGVVGGLAATLGVIEQVAVPRQVCGNETVYTGPRTSGGGAVLAAFHGRT